MQSLIEGILAEEARTNAESQRCVKLCALPVILVIIATICVAMMV